MPIVNLALGVLVAGVAFRLFWIFAGLWQTRRRRIAATPLYPIPPSVEAACSITHTHAVFCISSDAPGPVMLGWLAPVVLLPESFLTLEEEAQCAIVCHELLHVRRHDWLVTLLEECAGCLLWFQPAVWILLAQARLYREQLVDRETVRLTAAREPYLEALLAMARERPVADLAPAAAPLFLRRRHLTQRLHALLHEVFPSRLRLCCSYASIATVLAATGWFGFLSFPLVGSPRLRPGAPALALAPAPAATVDKPTQTPIQQTAPPDDRVSNLPGRMVFRPVTSVASIPPHSREPVVVPPQVVATPEDRAAVLAWLDRARLNGQMHHAGQSPYRLDVSFTTTSGSGDTGSGALTETWLSGRSWRWAAAMGGYSQTQIGVGAMVYSDRHVPTPMTVHLLRQALFAPVVSLMREAVIRTAAVSLNGRPATCALLSRVADARTATPARIWEETEYCVDNNTGLLQVYSVAPGMFAYYGYSRNVQFHGSPVPDHLMIYTGDTTLDAQIGIADAGAVDPAQFQPTPGLVPATVLAAPQRFAVSAPAPVSAGLIQPVIVAAEVDVDGHVLEVEVASASNPTLADAAVEVVRQIPQNALGTQRLMVVNVRFQ